MEKIRPGLTLLFLFAGCPTGSPIPGQPPIETAADVLVTPAASPPPRAPAASTVPETQASQAPSATPEAAQPADTPVLTQSSGPLTVQIFSDSDVEVSALKYLVSGRAPAGTVLSINDEITVVDQSQAFAVWVPLDEYQNLIEIVASDDAGDEVSFMLTVTCSSQP